MVNVAELALSPGSSLDDVVIVPVLITAPGAAPARTRTLMVTVTDCRARAPTGRLLRAGRARPHRP